VELRLRNVFSIIATVLVVMSLGADRLFFRPAAAIADGYHARVRAAIDSSPMHFDSWMGADVPVPTGAIKMLHLNALISRQFQNLKTGEQFTFVLVQVHDARDVLGHFPPACYPAEGWTLKTTSPMDWKTATLAVMGTEYLFGRDQAEMPPEIIVDNFFLLPDGNTCRDMDGVEAAAQNRRRKLFGASEVQFVFDTNFTSARRHEIVEKFLAFHQPVLDAIRSGGDS
jgi:Protein of unknown function (DUF3485)